MRAEEMQTNDILQCVMSQAQESSLKGSSPKTTGNLLLLKEWVQVQYFPPKVHLPTPSAVHLVQHKLSCLKYQDC